MDKIVLENDERLELQNIALRMNLETERIEFYKYKIFVSEQSLSRLQNTLDIWNKKFNEKLKKHHLDINKVEIDSETGIITPLE